VDLYEAAGVDKSQRARKRAAITFTDLLAVDEHVSFREVADLGIHAHDGAFASHPIQRSDILGDRRALSGICVAQEERRCSDGSSGREQVAARHSIEPGVIASVSLHDSTSCGTGRGLACVPYTGATPEEVGSPGFRTLPECALW
jgi:hypothetical protein